MRLCSLTDASHLHTQNKSFMRVKGSVQLSTYRMRSRDLRTADEFLQHVKSLPVKYERGVYFAFLEDYGTHYTKNGKTGGEYELIYVLNQDTIKKKGRSAPQSLFQLLVARLLSPSVLCDPRRSDGEKDSKMHKSRHHSRLHRLHSVQGRRES